MPSQFDALKVDRNTVLDQTFFNTRFRLIDDRLTALEALDISWQEALRVVQDKVLQQSESVISGMQAQLLALTQLQWLTATSVTSLTPTEGLSTGLYIDPADKALFAPGPYSVLSRVGSATDYALLQTSSYDRNTGLYQFTVETVTGLAAGPYTDWQIAAVAGSTLMQQALTAQGKTYRDDALAAKAGTDADAEATAADRAAVQTIYEEVQGLSTVAEASSFDSRITALEDARPIDEANITTNANGITAIQLDAARMKGRRRLFQGSLI